MCLDNAVKQFQSMRVIKLKEFWNNEDNNFVMNGSLTDSGFKTYWKSFDSTVAFNVKKRELFLAKSTHAALKRKYPFADQERGNGSQPKEDDMKRLFQKHRRDRNDKFHWHKDARDEDRFQEDRGNRFLLP